MLSFVKRARLVLCYSRASQILGGATRVHDRRYAVIGEDIGANFSGYVVGGEQTQYMA